MDDQQFIRRLMSVLGKSSEDRKVIKERLESSLAFIREQIKQEGDEEGKDEPR